MFRQRLFFTILSLVLALAMVGPLSAQIRDFSDEAILLNGSSTSGVSSIFFAQFGSGDGFSSDIVLINASSTPATGTIILYDEDGNPLNTPLNAGSSGNMTDFGVPAFGAATFSTGSEGTLRLGSARVNSDRPLGGVVRFQIPGAGIAGVGGSQPVNGVLIPVRRVDGGINTGIAVRSNSDATCDVDLTLFDSDGNSVATSQISLAPNARTAQFIDELFMGTDTSMFEGSLKLEGNNCFIAATGLELDTVNGLFTTLPVTPIGN